ncbi:MAG: hypothetical protein RR980_02305 [Mucinivorans sp.]
MKRIIFIALVVVYSFAAGAQQEHGDSPRNGHEEIAAQKIAYVTDKLDLTPSQSEKFWPIYNQYWEQRMSIGRAKRHVFHQIEKNEATQAQIATIVRLQREEADVIERYAKLFATVLPVDKVAKFFVAEESFKGFLFRNRVNNK